MILSLAHIPRVHQRNRCYIYIILGVCSLLIGIGYYFMPWVGDDLHYRARFYDYFFHNGSLEWYAPLGLFKEVCYCMNSRLANLCMCYLQLTPPPIYATITAVACYLCLLYALKLVSCQKSVLAAIALCSFFVFLMPWADGIYILDVALNYLYAGTLYCILSYMIFHRRGALVGYVFMSLICGAWCEAISLPCLIALLCAMCVYRCMRNRRTFISACGLCIGLLWLYISPGRSVYLNAISPGRAVGLNMVWLYTLPSLIYAALLLYKQAKHRHIYPLEVYLCITAISSAFICAYFQVGTRLAWVSMLACSIGFTHIIYKLFTCHGKWRTLISAILAACIVVHLCVVDIYAYREYKVWKYLTIQFQKHPEELNFADITPRSHVHPLALQKPYFESFSHMCHVVAFSYFHKGNGTLIQVAPLALKGLDLSVLAKDGEYIGKGFYLYKGYLVGPAQVNSPGVVDVAVDYGRGFKVSEYFYVNITDNLAWYNTEHSGMELALGLRPISANMP